MQSVRRLGIVYRRGRAEPESASDAPVQTPDDSMNSRGSWSEDGIEPSVRERAEAAARRAGMSLNEWLRSTAGHAIPDSRMAEPPVRSQDSREVADIHQRLDSITRQIDQLSSPAAHGEPAVARQLNDAISRLDARLARVAAQAPAPAENAQDRADRVERAAAEIYSRSTPPDPVSLEFAIAEVAARQHELDGASRVSPSPVAQAMTMQRPASDFSSLERQLIKITSQIEALQPPDGIEQSIAAFRSELAGIRHVITEAMPRRAIESIENEIRSLSQRIDTVRQSGSDGQALENVERALNEIYGALRSLKPAEQLAGFDEAIRNLGNKIDTIVRSSGDSGLMQQLENAIGALRGIVSSVASNDALARLSDDLTLLSSKVDQLGRAEGRGDSFAALEQRVAELTATLESRERPAASGSSEQLEDAVRALSDRLDRLPAGHDSSSALAHLEQRVSLLLERLEAVGGDSGTDLGRVEKGLQDVLRHLERQQAGLAALAEGGPRSSNGPTMDSEVVEAIKRELSEMRFCQSETDRHTQDSLEVVHNTLGHVVDRLAMIEGDLRAVRAMPAPRTEPSRGVMPESAAALPPKPELPNPVLSQTAPPQPAAAAPASGPIPPRARREIPQDSFGPEQSSPSATPRPQPPRPAIDPDLPPDHPLEPGTRPAARGAAARIAASESALGDIAEAPGEQSGSSFIAAARRAARAASAAAPSPDKAGRTKVAIEPARPATGGSGITSKLRSLLVGASVVVIVLGGLKFAMSLLDGKQRAAVSETRPVALPDTKSPADAEAAPGADRPNATPSMTSPTPVDRQSMNSPPSADSSAPVESPSDTIPASRPETPSADVTGAIPAAPASAPAAHTLEPIAIPRSESLPDGIGGSRLRTAALHGDAAAAFEVGVRYAEGKGVAVNHAEAAKWYDRAARAGVVPAMFRLGTLHEKGLGVARDLDAARRYYMQAAERDNAKAMHNLAVLDADGGGKGANYTSAAQWFRKAAERGVADSQFNIGILYARGIGIEQNLAEAYKWFSLAAAHGDVDSGRKRDEVAKRLDARTLAAARLAVQTFVPKPQPDDAINVATPPGGWDGAAAPTPAKTTAARSTMAKRAGTAKRAMAGHLAR
jgi:localization factor PodJL